MWASAIFNLQILKGPIMLVKQENGVIVSVNRKQIRDAKFAAKGKGSHSRGNDEVAKSEKSLKGSQK